MLETDPDPRSIDGSELSGRDRERTHNYSQEQERRDRLQTAVSQNQTALELSRELYTSGLGDFLAVLDAQRQLYGNEDLLAQSQTVVTTNLIALYKALGGGWESFPQQ